MGIWYFKNNYQSLIYGFSRRFFYKQDDCFVQLIDRWYQGRHHFSKLPHFEHIEYNEHNEEIIRYLEWRDNNDFAYYTYEEYLMAYSS